MGDARNPCRFGSTAVDQRHPQKENRIQNHRRGTLVLGALGVATNLNLLGGIEIPILQVGVPAVLSVYFDLFSGFVQAFVFSLLSMVYIAGACPPPEEENTK